MCGADTAPVLNNASGATLEFASTGSYVGNYYQNGGTTFNNAGTVVKRNEGTARLEGTLNNLGAAINVEGGTLNLSGGGSSSGGQFEVAAESLLQFTAGTSTYTLTGTYAGSGRAGAHQPGGCGRRGQRHTQLPEWRL